MASAARKSAFVKHWLSDTATYPIIGVMAAAVGLVTFQCTRIMAYHPDVHVARDERRNIIRENKNTASSHHDHSVRKLALSRPTVEMTPGLNNRLLGSQIDDE